MFDNYCSELVKHFQSLVSSVGMNYKLNITKREHLWHEFQLSRVNGKLLLLWKEMTTKLGVVIDDPLLEQCLYQELFEVCLKEHFIVTESSSPKCDSEIILPADELNVMRYVCGFVARHLLQVYEKRSGIVYDQYTTCLSEMAVDGEGSDVLSYTRKWMEMVNRGGLFPINENSFHLFIEIEKCVRIYLPEHLKKSKSGNDSFKDNVHNKIIKNENVQFYWTLLSQDIERPDDSLLLLTDIVTLWVTIRGYSIVAAWMEVYKDTEKTNIMKSTGLRKSLCGTS